MSKSNLLKIFLFSLFVVSSFVLVIFFNRKNKSENKKLLLTTISPLTLATKELVKDVPEIEVREFTNGYMENHECFHEFSLTTQQSNDISCAKALIFNGVSLENFVDKVSKNNKDLKIIDSSKSIGVIESDGRKNPYIWMSIPNYVAQIKNMFFGIAEIFPEYRDKIENNYDNYIKELENLDNKWRSKFSEFKNKKVFTLFNEFDYFLNGLDLCPVHLLDGHFHGELDTKSFYSAINNMKKENCHFYLVARDNVKYLETIKNETEAEYIKINLLDFSDSYIEKMEQNFEILYKEMKKYG